MRVIGRSPEVVERDSVAEMACVDAHVCHDSVGGFSVDASRNGSPVTGIRKNLRHEQQHKGHKQNSHFLPTSTVAMLWVKRVKRKKSSELCELKSEMTE